MARRTTTTLTCDRCGHIETIEAGPDGRIDHETPLWSWGEVRCDGGPWDRSGKSNGPIHIGEPGPLLCAPCIDGLAAWLKPPPVDTKP